MFTTKSLTLLAYDASKHSTIFYEADNDFEIMRYLVEWNIVPRTKELCDKLTQELVDNSLFHAMLQVTETGEVVGWITSGLDGARNRSGRLGIVIKQEHWGRGYAQEAVEGLLDYAFDNLGYHRVGLNVSAGNTRAIKLYEKIGFKEEGRIREVLYCNGLWEDSIEMGMLKKEWKVIRQTKSNSGTIS